MRDCYICGTPLDQSDEQGNPLAVSAEHVIPTSLLTDIDATESDRWPLVLDVHRACDERYKMRNDQLVKLIDRIHTGERVASREVPILRSGISVAHIHPDEMGPQPVFVADFGLYMLPVLWAKGMIAALYQHVSPGEDTGVVVGWPSTSFSRDADDVSEAIRNSALVSKMILGTMGRAIRAGKADSVVLRGGAIEFNATWIRDPEDGRWLTLWTLDHPIAARMSRAVMGRDIPWHGMIEHESRPHGAAVWELAAG